MHVSVWSRDDDVIDVTSLAMARPTRLFFTRRTKNERSDGY